jgi:thiol-disulfide isomerase/thioredoxin
MAATPSTMVPLGTAMPSFRLPDPAGTMHDGSELLGEHGLLVMFICNHCPFVIHVADELARLGRELPARGVNLVAIHANDFEAYPADAPDRIAAETAARGYAFPALVDEDQSVARAFAAACTPDFFLFDGAGRLFYRGQLDASRPNNGEPVTGADIRAAVDALTAGGDPPAAQTPSIGCNIKWKPDAT